MERVKLEEFNHWWISEKVDTELALPFKRDVYPLQFHFLLIGYYCH